MQVVRCFDDDDIHHVSGSIDPIRDIEVITTELVLCDLQATLQKRAERMSKSLRSGDKVAKAEMAVIEKILPHLDAGKPFITLTLGDEESKIARDFFLLTSKSYDFLPAMSRKADLAHIASEMEAAQEQEGGLPKETVEIHPSAR